MSVELILDKAAIDRAITKLGARYSISVNKVIKDQHRLYTEDMLKGTPPFTLAKGRESVAKDIHKIFIPLDKQDVLDYYAENFGKKPKGIGAKVRKSTRDLESQNVIFNWNGDQARMKGMHQKLRTGPQKGVRFKSRNVVVGNLTFGTGMYVPSGALNRYIKSVQKSVGKLKAGWVPSALSLGSKIPGWVMRQAVKKGTLIDGLSQTSSQSFLTSINQTPWAQRKLTSVALWATSKRQKALSQHMDRALEIVAKRWSASVNG